MMKPWVVSLGAIQGLNSAKSDRKRWRPGSGGERRERGLESDPNARGRERGAARHTGRSSWNSPSRVDGLRRGEG